jgi:hypothetical protein
MQVRYSTAWSPRLALDSWIFAVKSTLVFHFQGILGLGLGFAEVLYEARALKVPHCSVARGVCPPALGVVG